MVRCVGGFWWRPCNLQIALNRRRCNHAEPEQELQDYIIIERVYPEWVSEAGGGLRSCGLAESQDVEDFQFHQALLQSGEAKAVKAPKAAEGMDLQQLGRWRRPRSDYWHGAPDMRRADGELRGPWRHGWRAGHEQH